MKKHYQYYHSVNENNYFFRELSLPNNKPKRCDECQIQFKNCRQKRNHIFFCFMEINRVAVPLPVNILKRGPLIYYSINFYQLKKFYDFFDEKIVDSFFNPVKELFVPTANNKKLKVQDYFKLRNYQQTETVELENTGVWLTNVYTGRYFNEFIRGEIKKGVF